MQDQNQTPIQNNLKIKLLIEKYGVEIARAYLQERFSHPQNFWEFAGIFSDLLQDEVPDFHREIIDLVMPAGKYAFCAPRGGAKSTIIGLVYLAWIALNGYRHFVPYISDTHLQAKLIVGGLKNEIENNELLNFIYPDARSSKWGEEGFVVEGLKARTFILPLGAGMKIRGLKYNNYRPDLIIIDDLENLEIVYSPERRKKLKRWFDYDLEPAMDRYSKHIIYIGTILHYNALLKQVIEKQDKYGGWITRHYKALQDNGTSFWESRFSVSYLMAIKNDPTHPDYIGSVVFAQEMQNEPQDDKDRIIKLAWLKDYNFREKWITIEGEDENKKRWSWLNSLDRIGACDPAISEAERADHFSVYAYGFEEKTGIEYMLDIRYGKYPDLNKQVEIICDVIEEWKLGTFGIESNAFQKGLYNLVKVELQRRKIFYCTIIAITTDKDKIRRARIHSASFESGFILLRPDIEGYNKLKAQIEEFPLGEHDDLFDSLMLAREARRRPKARVFGKNPLR